MYHSFFRLNKSPFQLEPDPVFFWLSPTHKEALATMQYSLMNKKGFALITGDIGAGKSTLINSFLEILEDNIVIVKITNPPSEIIDLFNLLSNTLQIGSQITKKADFVNQFNEYVRAKDRNGERLLIIIDEAHRLSPEQFEELRLLANVDDSRKNKITFFFIGQNELNQVFLSEECFAIRSRITFHYQIEPLTKEETENYISFRLLIAGTNKALFSKRALERIYQLSKGNPRIINMICDRSLMTAYADSEKKVTLATINKCYKKLLIPGEQQSGLSFNVSTSPSALQETTENFFLRWKKLSNATYYSFKDFVFRHMPLNFKNRILLACISCAIILLFVWGHDHSSISKKKYVKTSSSSNIVKGNLENRVQPVRVTPEPKGVFSQQSSPSSLSVSESVNNSDPQPEAKPKNPLPSEREAEQSKKMALTNAARQAESSGNRKENLGFQYDAPSSVVKDSPIQNIQQASRPDSLHTIQSFVVNQQFKRAINLIEEAKRKSEATYSTDILNILYAKALRGEAKQLLKRNKKNKAIERLWQAISFDEANPMLYFEVGKILTSQKKYNEAIEMYAKSIEIDPNRPGAYYNLGYIYFVKKNYKTSEEMFKQCVKLNPLYLDKVFFNLAVVQYLQGEKKQCTENLQEAIRVNPENKRAKSMLSKIEKLNAEFVN